MLDAHENLLRFTQEDTAGAGQRYMLAAALEQSHAHCRFELPNLLAERWLRRMKSRSGPSEVQLFGHRHEISEMPQFHGKLLSSGRFHGTAGHECAYRFGPVAKILRSLRHPLDILKHLR